MKALSLQDIRMRDPFVLTDRASGRYYLYGTTDDDPWTGPGKGFDCYCSTDLISWDGPISVFRPNGTFWGKTHFWAPEVHLVSGRYAMLATFTAPGRRATQLLWSHDPTGPFIPIERGPMTPHGMSALDGTLWEEDEAYWLVFCHEWTQIHDGAIVAQRLGQDLMPAATPITLFHASDAPWSHPVPLPATNELAGFITDGPFLHRTRAGGLLMGWSSIGEHGYATGIARSESGGVLGPWTHLPDPLVSNDGGHAMIFSDLAGELRFVFHQPNVSPYERPRIISLTEDGELLRLG